MAERVGFEPTVPLRAQRFSRPSRSATLAPLRCSSCLIGGEGGIRTHGRVSPTHAFQACSLSHSDTSPFTADFSKNRPAEAGAHLAPASLAGRPLAAQSGKKPLQQRARLRGQHSTPDFEAVIQPRVPHQIAERLGRSAETRLRVRRAEDQPLHPRQHHRPGAHRAGLESDVEGAADQAPGAELRRRLRGWPPSRRARSDRDRARAGSARTRRARLRPSRSPLRPAPPPARQPARPEREPPSSTVRPAWRDPPRPSNPTILAQEPGRRSPPGGSAAPSARRSRSRLYSAARGHYDAIDRAGSEGFRSCASNGSEPRQARKGAAIRSSLRVPQECRNPSPPARPQFHDLPGSRPQVAPAGFRVADRPAGRGDRALERAARGPHRAGLSLLRHPRRRQDHRRARLRQGAQLRARHRERAVQRVPDLPGDHHGRRHGRARDRRRDLLEGRAGARARREPEVRAGARSLQGGRARRGPPPLPPGLRRAAQDRRRAAAAPGLHLRHHRDRRRAGDDPLALPGVPLPAGLERRGASPTCATSAAPRRSRPATRALALARARRRGQRPRLRRAARPVGDLRQRRGRRTRRPCACSAASTWRSSRTCSIAILAGDTPRRLAPRRRGRRERLGPAHGARPLPLLLSRRAASRARRRRRGADTGETSRSPPKSARRSRRSPAAPATRISSASSTICSAARARSAAARRERSRSRSPGCAPPSCRGWWRSSAIWPAGAGAGTRRTAPARRRTRPAGAAAPRSRRRAQPRRAPRRRARRPAASRAGPRAPAAPEPKRPAAPAARPPASSHGAAPTAGRAGPAATRERAGAADLLRPFLEQFVLRRPTLAALLEDPEALAWNERERTLVLHPASDFAASSRNRNRELLSAAAVAAFGEGASCASRRPNRAPTPAHAGPAAAPTPTPRSTPRSARSRSSSIRACRRCSRSSAARSPRSRSRRPRRSAEETPDDEPFTPEDPFR